MLIKATFLIPEYKKNILLLSFNNQIKIDDYSIFVLLKKKNKDFW